MSGLGLETETLEFKKTTRELKEPVDSACAILNKHGKGEIYFGIKPDGTPIGLTISEKTLRDISISFGNHLSPKIYPSIDIVYIEDKPLAIFATKERHTIIDIQRCHGPIIEKAERPIRRNPLIAQTLYYSQDAESFGTGLKRIQKACDESGTKVEFRTMKAGFLAIFYRKPELGPSQGRVGAESGPSVSQSQVGMPTGRKQATAPDKYSIIKMCLSKPLSASEIAGNYGQQSPSGHLKRLIREMCKDGILEFTIPEMPKSRLQKYRLTEDGGNLYLQQTGNKA